MKTTQETRMTELWFDKNTNKLFFVIKQFTYTPKIVRYEQVNYVKYPVYKGYSERIKVIKKFDRVINPIRFVDKEILELDYLVEKKFILAIIEEIGVIPEWRKKEIKLKEILGVIDDYKRKLRSYYREKKIYSFEKTDLNEEPSNFWLRLLLAPFTFGLSFFINYNSEQVALQNKKLNKENKEWNAQHEIAVDKENANLLQEITQHNEKVNKNISICWALYNKIKKEEIEPRKPDELGWEDIAHASNFRFAHLKEKKGVYIIWNKTKDKYYVGQSKKLGKRLNDHFSDGEVKNIIFSKDWYNNDYFCYKVLFCETKDELDSLEKQKIGEFNSLIPNGYNSTSGNW